MENKGVTAVFTSCGRFDFLKETINSFIKYNTYPISEYIVIDNSTREDAEDKICEILDNVENKLIIVNETNIGQVSSIDKAYSMVKTEYIFHCEDDWEFFDYGFIEKSINLLEERDDIYNVIVRVRFDGEKGSMQPVSDIMETKDGVRYHEFLYNFCGVWHGFSWNPGLRRLSDYNIVKPYKRFGNEQGMNAVMKQLNKKGACLENFYCKHIGTNSSTFKSNM